MPRERPRPGPSDPPETFALLYAAALTRRRMSLSDLRGALRRRGHQVSLATLSYWRSGQRQPERTTSLEILDELEAILLLPPGALRASLGPSRRVGHHAALSSFAGPRERAEIALEQLGLTHAQHDLGEQRVVSDVDVDARGQEVRARVRTRVVALRDGARSFPVVIDAGEPLQAPLRVESVRGCTVGGVVEDLDVGLLAMELSLDRPLALSETTTIEYQLGLADVLEPETDVTCFLKGPVKEVELWVRFDRLMLPRTAEIVAAPTGGTPVHTPIELDGSTSVWHVAHNVRAGTLGIRWGW